MRNLRLTIAYDGRPFVGWQVQPHGRSIQGELERAWYGVTQERIRITGSGRTDSGVHAIGQVATLSTLATLPLAAVPRALNAHLPPEIAVIHAQEVPPDFHAIRDARNKTYCYVIQLGPARCPFLIDRCWFWTKSLDVEWMSRAGRVLVGEHDFASFQSAGAPRKTTVRTVTRLTVQASSYRGFPTVEIQISANGFLYNMVRNIVGTLVQLSKSSRGGSGAEGQGGVPTIDVKTGGSQTVGFKTGGFKTGVTAMDEPEPKMLAILEAKDRAAAGPTAPAAGLTLMYVDYDS